MSCLIMDLSEVELRLARDMAKHRGGISRSDGVLNQRISDQSDMEIDFLGACGELAVARALNVYPDLTVQSRSGGFDLRARSGKRMEVKTTRYSSGKLIARTKARVEDSDIYVLVTGDPPRMTIRGYMATKEFLVPSRVGKLSPGHPEAYIASQTELKEWPTTIRDSGRSTNTHS